ncbi:hypothetical protein CKM354_000792500 [Cercospora kikuchii]|uniref:FAD-binding domain-containing protein n=1 Tax=Cercospora kikuchii TaxID=84275 RepID=A0A9P3CKZ1_9PEZI|nr:uncharacterized protein CKM354_000792500 [Cercospora kikuchii]GIZ44734.1 hypothetical protein CKM354_000792500 [Cercospora kikuchii]
MEDGQVVIVGAGPAGLTLGLALDQQGVKSLILEKEKEITQDPRGVVIAGDAVRILYQLGLGPDMPKIGHELLEINFHTSSFTNPPFHRLALSSDNMSQAVPGAVLQVQPKLEHALRKRIEESKFCTLRTSCEVTSIRHNDQSVSVEYTDSEGSKQKVEAAWLVGADGKRGIVRKKFLEPTAGIRQIHSDYRYEGTWVAANLKITPPTPETHPDFPGWNIGMTPDEVYDLFWLKGWHFCSPPGKPVACGRFGPHDQHFWRHEFRQDQWDDATMDAEELLWENLTPMITRHGDTNGRSFGRDVTFPRDCIEILRCRPFTFTHKVVNRWFHRRVILIGDAAHVFPPFGGQGIASGIRDAHQLAWRIRLLNLQENQSAAKQEKVLNALAAERTQSIKTVANFTKMNGILCNHKVSFVFYALQWVERLLSVFLRLKLPYDPQSTAERTGFQGVTGGFFLPDHGGGQKLPQIYLDSIKRREILSDSILKEESTLFHLIALVNGNQDIGYGPKAFEDILSECRIPKAVLSAASMSIVSTQPCQPASMGSFAAPTARKFAPTSLRRLSPRQARPGYDINAFESRFGKDTKYIIARLDFFTFATCKDMNELRVCLRRLAEVSL